jgi:NADH dehydrogenase
MSQKIIIAGSGFAGFWAAISASRAISLAGKEDDVEVIVVSPSANLVIRPRLYEADLGSMAPDINGVFNEIGVRHIEGIVDGLDAENKTIKVVSNDGGREVLAYDRFVLATGSKLSMPPIPGLATCGFNVDTLESATKLDQHLKALANAPETDARNTVVIAGGGFTGLEGAAEMPGRLREIFGAETNVRVVIVDPSHEIGAEIGNSALPHIREALDGLGIEVRPGLRVTSIDAEGAVLSDGERIAASTVIWTAGMRAHGLASLIPGEHDNLGRLIVDSYLRAPREGSIFVTGDVAKAATDDEGNFAVMSCQHALSMGRVAGHNAAADLVGLPAFQYRQPKYVTCLDLGSWGALYTEGWDRQVRYVRDEAKNIKREINQVWIYPPAADRDALFAVASPDYVIVP